MQVGWLNPRISSNNLGDQIIEDAVRKELHDLLGTDANIVELPTQRFLKREERRQAAECDLFVVGGTNLLNGNIPRYIQWKLDPWIFSKYAEKVVLLGVGWWQYQDVNAVSRQIWRRLLKGSVHSVRDSYTADRLQNMGLEAVNTGCPTMWRLPREISFGAERSKVIATVTDYHRDPERDLRMLRSLRNHYDDVFVWLQGAKDRQYLDSLDVEVAFVAPSLSAFDDVISSGEVDYFGTRLHAGVRALQSGVRATIVAIDNRATEISRDTGLPIVGTDFHADDIRRAALRERAHLTSQREGVDKWKLNFRGALANL